MARNHQLVFNGRHQLAERQLQASCRCCLQRDGQILAMQRQPKSEWIVPWSMFVARCSRA